jgi:hypothetical protein
MAYHTPNFFVDELPPKKFLFGEAIYFLKEVDSDNTKMFVSNINKDIFEITNSRLIEQTARTVSGEISEDTGIIEFKRDDNSTYTVDLSYFIVEVPTKLSELENDGNGNGDPFVTESELGLSVVAKTGEYGDLLNKPALSEGEGTVVMSENIVDTLEDLRLVENPVEGETYEVKSHNLEGLSENLGQGLFKFTKIPLLTIEGYVSFDPQRRRLLGSYSSTPLSRTLNVDSNYGVNGVTPEGWIIGIRNHSSNRNERIKVKDQVPTDSFFYLFTENADVDDNLPESFNEKIRLPDYNEVYMLDDDGVFIRPNYKNFDGVGYWERIMPEHGCVTPEMYGAVPTDFPTYYEKDNHKAIQKCFDNVFYPSRLNPNKSYYTSKELILRRSKNYDSVYLAPYKHNSRRITGVNSYGGTIFTDKNIVVVRQAGCDLQESTFNINTSMVKHHTRAAFKVDLGYQNRQKVFNLSVVGNQKNLGYRDEIGTKAYVMDSRDVSYDEDGVQLVVEDNYGARQGSFYFSTEINLMFYNCHTGIWRTKDKPGTSEFYGAFTNGLKFNIIDFQNTKQAINIERMISNSSYECTTFQTNNNVTRIQRQTTPWVVLKGRCYFDGYPMDMKASSNRWNFYKDGEGIDRDIFEDTITTNWQNTVSNEDDYFDNGTIDGIRFEARRLWNPYHFVRFEGDNIELGRLAKLEAQRRPYMFQNLEMIQGNTSLDLTNSSFIIPNRPRTNISGTFIEKLENTLLFANRSSENYYVKGFTNDGTWEYKDFLELSEGSKPEQSLISVDNPEGCFEVSKGLTEINFEVGSNTETDYVELHLDGNQGRLRNSSRLYITLRSQAGMPKQIQVNIADNKEPLTVEKITGTRTFTVRVHDSTNKYIIRFIGFSKDTFEKESEDTAVVDEETYTRSSYVIQSISTENPIGSGVLPYLHRGGDQTVLGDQTFIEGKGTILTANNGKEYRLVVDGSGNLTTIEV